MDSYSFLAGVPAPSAASLRGGATTKKGLLIASGVLFGVGVILLIVMLIVKCPKTSTPPAAARPRAARAAMDAGSEQEARDALGASTPAIVFLHADWCGHCKRADPIYTKLAGSPEFKHIKMLKLNSTQGAGLAREHGVRGFPTFLANWGEGKYTGFMPEDKMRAVLAAASGGARKGVRARHGARISKQGGTTEVEEDVVAALSGSTPAVVFMSMQGCGFCQKQQPLWDAAASSGKFNHVKMLQIDGKHARELARKHGVTGFPTMLSNRGNKKYVGYKSNPQFEEMLVEIGKA